MEGARTLLHPKYLHLFSSQWYTGTNGNVYWTHYHAGTWITGHDRIWETIEGKTE